MKKIRVALGLSGGVDSAVAAYLLKIYGYDVHCVYLNCYDPPAGGPGCRGDQDRKDALNVALYLDLPFQVLDLRKEYKAAVIDYFKREYLAGRTPNPDVVCNRDIKFGLFLDWAIKHHFEYVATGHYAKLIQNTRKTRKAGMSDNQNIGKPELIRLSDSPNFRFSGTPSFLSIPKDLHKDQTYFLWAVPAEKFERVLFPLGDYLKTEVREIARKAGLLVAEKKDSTGICFVGEVRVEDFLKSLGVKEKIGEVVIRKKMATMAEMAKNGYNHSPAEQGPALQDNHFNPFDHYQIIGSHRGVWFYTIGQRHGFDITQWPVVSSPLSVFSSKFTGYQSISSEQTDRKPINQNPTTENRKPITDRPPLYVIEKDIKNNRLIVGFGAECYRDSFEVSECNWLAPVLRLPLPWSTSTRPPAWTSSMRSRAGRGVASTGLRRPGTGLLVRLRHGGELIPCSINASTPACNGFAEGNAGRHQRINVLLRSAQRGIAPGQSAVFYLPRRSGAKAGSKNGIVLGGGVIQ